MIYFISACTMIAFIYFLRKAYNNTKDIQVRNINPTSDAAGNKSTLSILHLSDLHLEHISISPAQLAAKLRNEPIDMIALTGDFLDRKRTIPKLDPYLRVLQSLEPAYGVYAVLGNHDYVLDENNLTALKNMLENYDVRVLQNGSDTILANGHVINIIGIDDSSTNRSDLSAAYQHVENGMNIVLTHDPNIVLEMQNYKFDYLMAGHFHGGQICYPKAYHLVKMGKLARQNVIKGLHYYREAPFYISEGLGQTGFNMRVGSRPEITFHHIAFRAVEHVS
ncbi:metallophosphoesterase [Lentibacillus juripiscarius]|uniref:Metallophosphoesterase n=1 Tax=Lentibacillus juripiscarius TaxID=257446 RepID=A0ABW5V9C5_9BACI